MKLIKVFVLFIIFTIFVVPYSLGYSTQYLDFKVPKGYEVTKEEYDEATTYLIKKENSDGNIVIAISKLNEPILNFKYNDENLDSILDAFFETENNNSEYDNFNHIIKKRGTSVIGKKPYSCYDVLLNESNYNLVQRQFICITDNYNYTFTLTSSDTKFFHSSEAFTLLNSIEIHDTITTDNNYIYSEESDEKKWFERGIDGALERCSNWRYYYTCLCSIFSNNKKK